MRAFPTLFAKKQMSDLIGADDPVPLYDGTQVVALADRRSNDIEVVLLWARQTGRLWVDVTHRPTGRIARIDATPADALDVFHHPFAHGAQ